MRKFIMILSLLAGTAKLLNAQIRSEFSKPMSEYIFNSPAPKSTRVYFDFNLGKARQVTFEMRHLQQLNHVPDLDSLMETVKKALTSLKDSFKADGIVRKIDFVASQYATPRIRITAHGQRPNNYGFVDNELVQLKIDSDTLRIIFYTPSGASYTTHINGEKRTMTNDLAPFTIMFTVNNLDDVYSLPENTLSQCLAKVKEHTVSERAKPGKGWYSARFYYAMFDMTTGKIMRPITQRNLSEKDRFEPTMHMALQYGRGNFIPSAALGVQVVHKDPYSYYTAYFRLLWEPHFFFSGEGKSGIHTDRNDFVALQYAQIPEKRTNKLETTGNVSLGYLVRRKGEWFQKNTFKVGMPGFSFGSCLLAPEFYFNGAFRDFSPSLKLTLFFE